ncbi:MAG TPA: DUF1016 N-terminal domain-containing protein [Fibrobacteria bacterium]|nr:DUF1016 N-terminal domain-containing protein [Fibrobacteria bacterium]
MNLTAGGVAMRAHGDGRKFDFGTLGELVRVGRERAWLAANAQMITTYFQVGAALAIRSLDSDWTEEEWDSLSRWLVGRGAAPLGFSSENLKQMKRFHEVWSPYGDLPPKALALSWGCHLVLLEACTSHHDRLLFLDAAIRKRWSPQELSNRIRANGRSGADPSP